MSLPGYVTGLPRVGALLTAAHRRVFLSDVEWWLAGGRIVEAAKSGDPGNTGDVRVLRAGLLMGKVTTGGRYAPSIVGVTQAAIAAAATTINILPAQAVELVRRIGATGTLRLTGPPTAAGVVASFTETYSAVNTGTGDVTISAADAALIAGSFVAANDGSHVPVTLIADGYGLNVLDSDGVTQLDQPFARFPIGGLLESTQLLPVWPSDTSLQQWIVDQLQTASKLFTFDHKF